MKRNLKNAYLSGIETHSPKYIETQRREDACKLYYQYMKGKQGKGADEALAKACNDTGANPKTVRKIIGFNFGKDTTTMRIEFNEV